MAITDLMLAIFVYGTAGLASRPFVYGSLLGTVLLGRFIRRRRAAIHVGGAALAGSLLFFVVTNFGMWLYSPLYPLTGEGFSTCFAAALPFFQKTVVGDMFFAGVLFAGFALSQQIFPILAEAKTELMPERQV